MTLTERAVLRRLLERNVPRVIRVNDRRWKDGVVLVVHPPDGGVVAVARPGKRFDGWIVCD